MLAAASDPTALVVEEGLLRHAPIPFEPGGVAVTPAARPILNEIAQFLTNTMESSREVRVIIEGHTDFAANIDWGRRLSKRRAQRVAEFLSRRGLDLDRVRIEGKGHSEPLVPRSATDRARNRRIVFRLEGLPPPRPVLPELPELPEVEALEETPARRPVIALLDDEAPRRRPSIALLDEGPRAKVARPKIGLLLDREPVGVRPRIGLLEEPITRSQSRPAIGVLD